MKFARIAVLALLAVSFAAAGTSGGNDTSVDWNKAEQNYVAALKTNNAGLQVSAATQIRKYNLTGAVDELKQLLCKDCQESVKMSAALTLVKIGGKEGREAVEKALDKEESELVSEFFRTILNTPVTAQN